MSQQSKGFYLHLHAFRGFSIINIVAAHTWVMLVMIMTQGQVPDSIKQVMVVSETFFHNATIYFAVISGILFSLILRDYSWKKFYIGKFKNVVCPYLVFSIFLTFLGAMVLVPPGTDIPSALEVSKTLPIHILKGTSFGHMWYIPVLVVLFLLTPLLSYLVSQPKLLPIVILLLLCPLVISRSWPDITWQNFVFFVGPYTLGLFIGANYQKVLDTASEYRGVIVSAVIASAAVLYYLYSVEFEAVSGVKLQESVGYVNKVLICLLVLNFMYSKEEVLPKFLSTLGSYSFAIYFVHMIFVIIFAVIIVNIQLVAETSISVFLWGFPLLVITLLTSIGFTKLIKMITRKYSRFVIGS